MNIHQNARLTRHGRERIVRLARGGQTPNAIANTVGVCPRTVRKWLTRYRDEGAAGLLDRSSPGGIAITGTGRMVAWMQNHLSAASALPRTTG